MQPLLNDSFLDSVNDDSGLVFGIGHTAGLEEQRSLRWRLCRDGVRQQLAGRLRSPRAASEQSSSQNLDLADWPVWRKLTDGLGS